MLDNTKNLPATMRRLSDIVDEYEQKHEAAEAAKVAFEQAVTATEMASTVGGTYANSVWGRYGSASVSARDIQHNLLQSAWKHVYNGLQIDKIAPAGDRDKFERGFENPAPFTLDNIRATFGAYIADPRSNILRGLAECFGKLDPAFKSHSKMKIGVEGLPKRVIVSNIGEYGHGWGADHLRDIVNALRAVRGQGHVEHSDFSDWLSGAKKEPADFEGMTLKRFKNGNGHLHFDKPTLKEINLALAEYFGEVLPDTPDESPTKRAGTDVSKDLQFYKTPQGVADEMVERANPEDGARILEPSCGDGAILEAVRRFAHSKGRNMTAAGVEVDPTRAQAAKDKGFGVWVGNFLQTEPEPIYDYVLMNPPFYGKHYQKHVEHARKFLKPDGVLFAILPVTAVTDHNFVEPGNYGWDKWKDLPAGSFSESGTNINTGIARFFAPK